MQFRSDLLEPVKASLLLTISKPLDASKVCSFSFIVSQVVMLLLYLCWVKCRNGQVNEMYVKCDTGS